MYTMTLPNFGIEGTISDVAAFHEPQLVQYWRKIILPTYSSIKLNFRKKNDTYLIVKGPKIVWILFFLIDIKLDPLIPRLV